MAVALATGIFLGFGASAQATTVDFSGGGFGAGDIFTSGGGDDITIAPGVTANIYSATKTSASGVNPATYTERLSNSAMLFNTNCTGVNGPNPFGGQACSGNDDDLGGPFPRTAGSTLGPATLGNTGLALIISTDNDGVDDGPPGGDGPNDHAGGGTIVWEFSETIQFQGVDFLDVEEGHLEIIATYQGQDFVILDFDDDFGVANNAEYIRFETDVLADRIAFVFAGSGALDNFEFEDPTPIPLPAGLPLFVGALAMLGWAGARRGTAKT